MAEEIYDFCGWATRNNVRCADGLTIMRDAFKHNDGQTVPIVWNHSHNDPDNVLGHGRLENRDEGVYIYGKFNDTERGRLARNLVQHGDIEALSIYANHLKKNSGFVMHGDIREVSLVLAGANPGAYIEEVIRHGDDDSGECAVIYTGEELALSHTDTLDGGELHKSNNTGEKAKNDWEDKKMAEDTKKQEKEKEEGETVGDVWETLTEKQKTAVYAVIAQAIEDNGGADDTDTSDSEEKEDKKVKHNIFESDRRDDQNWLSHSDEENILNIAKSNSVGSLQDAISIYAENNDHLAHGFDSIEELFPDYKDVRPGAPEMITRDQGWVNAVMQGCDKSPISRIRTRFTDLRQDDLRGRGYVKGKKKAYTGNIKLLKRTTDPQTIYCKDALKRDDIVDITDFDVVQYQYNTMRQVLNEEIATAVMIGDDRAEGDEAKIEETHIRSIWNDDDLYTIHADIDIAAAKKELQGTNTSANFGDSYIQAEAVISASLYAREQYKGSGNLDFYCTPHLLNVMLLARDLNGRRIYDSKADLAAALNVSNIYTVEQFEGRTRTDKNSKIKKLLGLFVNLSDYRIGATKGGQITSFNQFDIDFNQEKYLIETRISGALTRAYSAIALEEPVNDTVSTEDGK